MCPNCFAISPKPIWSHIVAGDVVLIGDEPFAKCPVCGLVYDNVARKAGKLDPHPQEISGTATWIGLILGAIAGFATHSFWWGLFVALVVFFIARFVLTRTERERIRSYRLSQEQINKLQPPPPPPADSETVQRELADVLRQVDPLRYGTREEALAAFNRSMTQPETPDLERLLGFLTADKFESVRYASDLDSALRGLEKRLHVSLYRTLDALRRKREADYPSRKAEMFARLATDDTKALEDYLVELLTTRYRPLAKAFHRLLPGGPSRRPWPSDEDLAKADRARRDRDPEIRDLRATAPSLLASIAEHPNDEKARKTIKLLTGLGAEVLPSLLTMTTSETWAVRKRAAEVFNVLYPDEEVCDAIERLRSLEQDYEILRDLDRAHERVLSLKE